MREVESDQQRQTRQRQRETETKRDRDKERQRHGERKTDQETESSNSNLTAGGHSIIPMVHVYHTVSVGYLILFTRSLFLTTRESSLSMALRMR